MGLLIDREEHLHPSFPCQEAAVAEEPGAVLHPVTHLAIFFHQWGRLKRQHHHHQLWLCCFSSDDAGFWRSCELVGSSVLGSRLSKRKLSSVQCFTLLHKQSFLPLPDFSKIPKLWGQQTELYCFPALEKPVGLVSQVILLGPATEMASCQSKGMRSSFKIASATVTYCSLGRRKCSKVTNFLMQSHEFSCALQLCLSYHCACCGLWSDGQRSSCLHWDLITCARWCPCQQQELLNLKWHEGCHSFKPWVREKSFKKGDGFSYWQQMSFWKLLD